ncbi:hypothetical protein J5289_21430 [Rhizobium sp. B230/85]|nr:MULTISPECIES: hypothetical protein [unclassified Rhizobium]MBO9136790.1 hypothetical protein [Rhizobium sp. B209b/85]QXZ99062.1 hypothetical protein J5289_21430 [Rhizobium sp. B230/85]
MRSAFTNPDDVLVLNLAGGGKSKIWNTFLYEKSRKDESVIVLPGCGYRIARTFHHRKADPVCPRQSSDQGQLEPAGQGHPLPSHQTEQNREPDRGRWRHQRQNLRTAICGQLYAMRSSMAREIKLPIGLPVEDGFIRHSIITTVFS